MHCQNGSVLAKFFSVLKCICFSFSLLLHIHILSSLTENRSDCFFYFLKEIMRPMRLRQFIYYLTWGSCCVIREPNNKAKLYYNYLIIIIKFCCCKPEVSISSGHWSFFPSLPFFTLFLRCWVEVLFVPQEFSWLLRIVFSISDFCFDWKRLISLRFCLAWTNEISQFI